MTLLLPNTIDPLSPADAVEVQQNYSVTQQYINANLIHRDGSVQMQAPLTLFGSPSQDQHAATKAYVDAILPVGVCLPFAGAAAPAGQWALCNGADLAVSSYAELHAVIGYRYGGSAGTFKLPNLNGKIPIGADATQTRFDTTGKVGGSWIVPVPEHKHSIKHNHPSFNTAKQSVKHTHSMAHDHASATGTGAAHSHQGRFLNIHIPTTGTTIGVFVNSVTTTSGSSMLNYPTADGSHGVTVNLPSYSGNTGQDSVDHTHPVDVPEFTGDSANTGTANAEHLPPFVVLNYIIRVS